MDPQQFSKTPSAENKDSSDFVRLRHARERNVGFAVGRYLQTPPMLFTRDGHNVFLGDMFRGHTAFLLCGGPSLTSHDLGKLNQRGIVTLAVNNAAAAFRPHLWTSVDDPGNFCDAIWYDPGILKFVPLCHMEKHFTVRDAHDELVPSQQLVGDMPAVFGYRRNEAFNADQWLHEDTFNWGNHSDRVDAYGNKGSRSVLLIALRLLFYLGFRRVYLLGCDFRMRHGRQNYAFEQDRSRASVRGNNKTFRTLNCRLEHLKPHFEKEGFQIFNCTPDSGLTVFPHVPFEEAIETAATIMPKRIVTTGMYDRNKRMQETLRRRGDGVVDVQQRQPAASRNGQPSAADIADAIPKTTLIVHVDDRTQPVLRHTWPTWMKLKPWLAGLPLVLIHEAGVNITDALGEDAVLRATTFCTDEFGPEGDSASSGSPTALLKIACEHVETPWMLFLDAQAVAVEGGRWPAPEWFRPDSQGQLPKYIGHPWGYTKPVDAIARLDEWGNQAPQLSQHAPLNLPCDPADDRVRHSTISEWCLFVDASWARQVVDYGQSVPPCASLATLLYYCATRRGDYGLRAPMKELGWDHSFSWHDRKIVQRCRKALAEAAAAGR